MKPRKAVYLLVGSPALKRAKECLTRKSALGLRGQAHEDRQFGATDA
ncbi:hypothetical protein [Vibrio sp. Vb1337]|nr:hypothetical protein [Vibrio sp. Vb1337]MDW1898703.1 hypothetical protein [Vibrio sp. Vb1337]